MILREGENCWRIEYARRLALLIDGENYFPVLHKTLENARRRVMILAWDLRNDLQLGGDGTGPTIGEVVNQVASRGVDVYILVWDWPLWFDFRRELFPWWAFGLRASPHLHFVLDDAHATGACHHEKVVVVDGSVAFAGGIDITSGRFDRPSGSARLSGGGDGEEQKPFHDGMLMVSGPVAKALEELACERWNRATGEHLAATGGPSHDPWPDSVQPLVENKKVAIARTRYAYNREAPVQEIRKLLHDAFSAAEQRIYVENQYLTVASIADTIGERLRQRPGLEALLVTPQQCEGEFETAVMDVGRQRFNKHLKSSNAEDRFRIMAPMVPRGDGSEVSVMVHSKITFIDDKLLLVGSANIANRSMYLDTECVLALEADPDDEETRGAIRFAEATLLAEHLGRPVREVEADLATGRSLVAMADSGGRGGRRLAPLEIADAAENPEFIALSKLADAEEPLTANILLEQLAPARRRKRVAPRMLLCALALLALLALASVAESGVLQGILPVDRLLALGDAISPVGFGVASIAFLLGTLVLVPVSLLIVLSSMTFGLWLGLAQAMLAGMIAAVAGFALGRVLGLEPVRRLMGRRVNLVSRRLGEESLGGVIRTRLLPMAPFAVVNFVAGACNVRLAHFLIGTLAGMVPGVIFMGLVGAALRSWLQNGDGVSLILVLAVASVTIGIAALSARWLMEHAERKPKAPFNRPQEAT